MRTDPELLTILEERICDAKVEIERVKIEIFHHEFALTQYKNKLEEEQNYLNSLISLNSNLE